MKNIHIIPTKINSVDILDLNGNVSEYKNQLKFGLINSEENFSTNIKEIYSIISPSNDQAFKVLFNGENIINGISGFQRAKSLIKSLLYKFPDNKEIVSISYMPNEIPEVSGKNRKKLKVLDCPLLCQMNDGSEYIIDLEMQNYWYDGIDINALSYGTALYNSYNKPVIIILLLLKDSAVNNYSFEIMPFKNNFNEGVYKPIDDNVYVICFDLYYILECINKNIQPELNGFEIDKEGKAWIKLLTIKEWMRKFNNDSIKRYALPLRLNNSNEIISAITILNKNDNSKLIQSIIKEAENSINIDNIEKNHAIKLWIRAFLNGLEPINSSVPFPDVPPESLIIQCEKHLDKNNSILFLNWLFNHKIIPNKEIYQNFMGNN